MDPDHLFGLVLEVIPDHSCLVFCPTKKNCENVAMMLCKMMVKYKRYGKTRIFLLIDLRDCLDLGSGDEKKNK